MVFPGKIHFEPHEHISWAEFQYVIDDNGDLYFELFDDANILEDPAASNNPVKSGSITYNGTRLDEFFIQRTAAYISYGSNGSTSENETRKKRQISASSFLQETGQLLSSCVVNKKCIFLLEFEQAISRALEDSKPNDHPFGGQVVSASALGWAMSTVSSRAFSLYGKKFADGNYSEVPKCSNTSRPRWEEQEDDSKDFAGSSHECFRMRKHDLQSS